MTWTEGLGFVFVVGWVWAIWRMERYLLRRSADRDRDQDQD